jgi:hypothetical protein
MLDFIERWFDVAPDNGNGAWEVLLFIVLIVVLIAIAMRLMITNAPPG